MSIYCTLVRTLSVVFLAAYAASQELNSTLYSTIFGVSVAFSNENIVFTCVARGSNHMGWSSDEYIGTGGRRLDFISTNNPGTNRTSGTTRAELISASVDQFIVSQLYISIESTIPIATVRCENIGAGTMRSLSFELADNDVSVTCDKRSVCPGETVTCVCATGGSNALMWVIDGRRLVFASTDPLLTRHNVTGSSTYGILTDTYNRNGIQVITSNLTAIASMSGTSLLIQCENVGRSTSNTDIISVSQAENCPDPNETTPSPGVTDPTQSTSSDCTPAITALAIVCALIILLFVAAVVIIIIAWIKITGRTKKFYNDKIIEKDEEIKQLEGEKESLEKEMKEKDITIGTLEKGMEEKDITIGTLNSEKDMKDGEIVELRDKNKELTTKKDGRIKQLEDEIQTLTTGRIKQLEGEIQTLATKKDLEIQHLTMEKDREIQRLTSELDKLEKGKSTIETQEKKKVEKKKPTKNVSDDPSSKKSTPTNQPEPRYVLPPGYVSHPSQRNGSGAGTSQGQ